MSAKARLMERYMNDYAAYWPMAGVALAAERDEIVYERAFGYASLEHLAPHAMDSKFRIWSLTKSFTAMAVMLLHESGKLDFADPIGSFFPITELDEAKRRITVEQLLTHTSGLANYTAMPEYNGRLNKLPLAQDEVVRLFADEPLAFEPGSAFDYSNSGYFLLGMLIERAAGIDYERYLSDAIWQPLGMKDTGLDDSRRIIAGMSSSYDASGDENVLSEALDMSSSFAAGALYSTARDLLAWDRAWRSERLVSQRTLDRALRTGSYDGGNGGAGSDPASDARREYGFGWFLDTRSGRRRVRHGGAYRGCRSELHRYPDERSAVIVLTNFDYVPVAKLAEALGGLLHGEAPAVPELPPPFPLDEAEYAELAGTYEGFGCQAVVARDGERLFFVWNRRTIVPFYPIAPRRFHHTWQDWQCEFARDADGAIRFLGMKKVR